MASLYQKQYILIVLAVTIMVTLTRTTSRVIPETSMRERHEQWMSDYGREYKNGIEKEERYNIFKANAEYIHSVNNAGNKPYKLSINQFADKTNKEFKSTYTTYKKPLESRVTPFWYENLTAVPPSIDWRKKGAVTGIRGGSCGAWTYPAVDTVESITMIKSGTLYNLSVQEILDCSSACDGCTGGLLTNAFDFIKQKGLTTESNYPSNEKMGTCDVKKEAEPVAKISSYGYVPADDEEALMVAVAGQPVAVSVDASGAGFQFYKSGVFTGECGTDLDHGVTVVGYGTENGKLKYWIVKNSWGTSWGEEGYMRLERDIVQREGQCGIAMEALYPIV
ncbi:hypothetical protein ACS0TY_032244 [Phlomoides rotata]